MSGESSKGRPVWKQTGRDERFLFYGHSGWSCGATYGSNLGGYMAVENDEVREDGLPSSNWRHYPNGSWVGIPSVAVEGMQIDNVHP